MRLNQSDKAPLWAVLGAPLIGVPLLVALLALTAPMPESSIEGPVWQAPTEQVEVVQPAELLNPVTDCTVEQPRSG